MFIFIVLCFVTAIPAYAQVTAVSLSVNPENAQTGDIVTVSATSYSEDLTRSVFTWTANGKVVKKGSGVTSISFRKIPSLPLVTIGVSINLASGQTIQQSVDITNQNLDLLWEAVDAYTPPFYKGKAMPVTEGSVRFSPIMSRGGVFGSNGNKNNIYTWSRSNDVVGTASGTGKDSFPIVMDYMLNKEQIGVRVEGISSNSIQETKVDLVPQNIQVLFYPNNNGFINWNKPITDGYTLVKNTKIVAAPYYITPKTLKNVSFNWNRNTDTIYGGQNIDLTPTNEGATLFNVSIENTNTFFQSVKKSLLLTL